MAWTVPLNNIAMYISGDLGELTCYTDKHGRPTWFPKDTPSRPPSPEQIALRNRFRQAQQSWKAADATTRDAYERATRTLSMPLTGQNLWISVSMRGELDALATVARQSGETLPPPPLFL